MNPPVSGSRFLAGSSGSRESLSAEHGEIRSETRTQPRALPLCRGRFLSASPAPGRTPPGPQATRASDTDPGKQGAARLGTQRGEGSGAARAPRRLGRSGEEMGVLGHGRRAVGAGPPRCGKSLPAPSGRALFLAARGSGELGCGTRSGRGLKPFPSFWPSSCWRHLCARLC